VQPAPGTARDGSICGRQLERGAALGAGQPDPPAASLNEAAWQLARHLANGPPLVFAAIKEVVREAENQRFQDILNRVTKRQLATVDRLYGSEDLREGFNAFTEKREPRWTGS